MFSFVFFFQLDEESVGNRFSFSRSFYFILFSSYMMKDSMLDGRSWEWQQGVIQEKNVCEAGIWARKDLVSYGLREIGRLCSAKEPRDFCVSLVRIKEKTLAPQSSTLAWKIPWTEEPGGLQSMGSQGLRHHWVTSLSLFTFMHWRRKWQPTPVFLPGESQGRWSLVGCHLWGCTESDTTEVT